MELLDVFGKVLFSTAAESTKALLVAAVKSGANLSWANLSGADLSGADLSRANLSGADLSGAGLSRADLSGANLSRADLSEADLSGADLSRAGLSRADLSWANLSRAGLSGANLSRADLSEADLSGADLSGANNFSDLGAARLNILPHGSFIGWKKCRDNVIVKLMISHKVKRSNATGRKCRAESVRVIEVFGANEGVSIHDGITRYRKGETVHCNEWNENRWVECGGGIHFYLSRIEAEDN